MPARFGKYVVSISLGRFSEDVINDSAYETRIKITIRQIIIKFRNYSLESLDVYIKHLYL